jgi:hypothetical protein
VHLVASLQRSVVIAERGIPGQRECGYVATEFHRKLTYVLDQIVAILTSIPMSDKRKSGSHFFKIVSASLEDAQVLTSAP